MRALLLSLMTVLMFLTSLSLSETRDDLVIRDRLYYKKFSDVPFTGKLTGKYQGSFKNGKREDTWLRYWENGQLSRKGDYKNRLKESSWVEYYSNGQLWKKGDIKNGKKEGSWVSYWSNGKLFYQGDYNKNGKREGSWVYYHSDGIVDTIQTGTYKNGRKKISD